MTTGTATIRVAPTRGPTRLTYGQQIVGYLCPHALVEYIIDTAKFALSIESPTTATALLVVADYRITIAIAIAVTIM